MKLPPLALYIHIPWCVKKCPYCDFNSHQGGGVGDALPEDGYLDALLVDLDNDLSLLEDRRTLCSIFIGGGTPSLLSGDFYRRLLRAINARLTLADGIEITLEANPGAVDAQRFAGFVDAGINRLSLGVQSFSDAALTALGRIHSADEALCAFELARGSGFENINIDLMHGLPGQSLEAGLADLSRACSLGAEHISWYQLTIERNTEFYKRPPALPDEGLLGEIFQRGLQRLAESGYRQYEVSAFSRQERCSQHNTNYWKFGDYLGIGAGAHGKLTTADGRILRRWKRRMPSEYLQATDKLAGSKQLSVEDLPLEFMMNALRLNEGFSPALFEARTGLGFAALAAPLADLQREGLLEVGPDRVRTTARGHLFLDDVLARFIP